MERLLKRQLEKNEDNTFAWMNLIHLYRNQRKWETVIELALKVATKSASEDEKQMIAQDVVASWASLEQWDAAIKVAKAALEREPDNQDMVLLLAHTYHKSGQLPEAVTYFRRFIAARQAEREYGPANPLLLSETHSMEADAWGSLALLYQELGWEDERQTALRQLAMRRSLLVEG